MENLLEAIQNSKGLYVNFECPHCYASVYIKYTNPDERPESIFCPTCGIREEIEPLNFDDVDWDTGDDWDE